MAKQKSMLEQLQEILLREDRESTQKIKKDISNIEGRMDDIESDVEVMQGDVANIKDNMDNPDKFGATIEPFINLKINEFVRDFDKTVGYEVTNIVKKEMKNSQDEMVQILYPIMGKLIKHYLKLQFDVFLDNVNTRIDSTFSTKRWGNRFKAMFSGVKANEILIKESFVSNIEEVFIIDDDSGLLIASYSQNDNTDIDLIAGMLTAIKQFVADNFSSGKAGDLETIAKGNSTILINSFPKYYVATVISSKVTIDARFKMALDKHLRAFDQNSMPHNITDITSMLFNRISKQLKKSFEEFEHNQK